MPQRESPINHDELLSHLKELAEPIDFEALENDGLIVKDGAWYRVPNQDALPSHAAKKIDITAADSKGIKVKFKSHKKYEAMLKKHLR
ncbi:MAG TPA: hypothetical protein DEG93_09310 [Gammaproteobacteria bacterium]|nr:hypothetical protein [Gammaproteobacteria bacterium]|tara:strand:- start:2002 stop:2265 length:264 start_codon:yes stop_codon:yes gene_type:complete